MSLPAALWIIACGNEGAHENSRGQSGGTGGSAPIGGGAGKEPGTGGSGGTSSSGGGAGTGAGGTGGTGSGAAAGSPPGGTTGSAGGAGVACDDAQAGAMAGPSDFSANSETGAPDGHYLSLDRGNLIRRVTQYETSGEAGHQHEIVLSNEQIEALLRGESVTVETNGPPLNASSGHSHTVTVHPCAQG